VIIVACGASLAVAEPTYKHGVSFFGKFKYPPDFKHFDYVNPEAPKGGTLVLATDDNWNSFTPYLAKGNVPPSIDHQYGSQPFFYDSLFHASDDEIGTFYGNLVGEVMVADDFSWVRMRVRPEARWHDGVPVTARDVQFTFQHIHDNSGFNLKSAFGMVDSVEIHSEREFTIHLININGLNTGVVASLGKIAILPEHYWRKMDVTKTTMIPPLGSGPYRVTEFEQSRYLVYERVPDYWGRNLGIHRGRHNFDYIRYEYYRDATVAREAFRKGLIDYRQETDSRYWYNGYNIPARDKGWIVTHKNNFQYYVGVLQGLVINQRRAHLKDARVREALVLAFHQSWYDRVISQGFYLQPDSYFVPSNFAATGLPSEAELALLNPYRDQLPPRLFTEPFGPPRAKSTGPNRAALIKAHKLLQQAGWTVRDGILTNATGEQLSLSFIIQTAAEKRMILPYIDQLRTLGFVPSVRQVEAAQFINYMRNFDFDFRFGFLAVAQPPGVEIVSYWHSSNALLPLTRNLTGIQSEAADEMLLKLLDARTREELIASGRALDRVLLWNFGMIPLRAVEGPSVIYWDKFGRPPKDAQYRTSFPAAWWYDEKKSARIQLNN
jgi:microcin C transport system substrate-binding protein